MQYRHQHQFSLNVSFGIMGDQLFFHFLPPIPNGERYLFFDLPTLLEDVPLMHTKPCGSCLMGLQPISVCKFVTT